MLAYRHSQKKLDGQQKSAEEWFQLTQGIEKATS
jgi:hypothetical protein